jgi:hypothetical protein
MKILYVEDQRHPWNEPAERRSPTLSASEAKIALGSSEGTPGSARASASGFGELRILADRWLGSQLELLTRNGQSAANFAVLHNSPQDVVG